MPALYPTADRPLALPVPDPLTARELARVVGRVGPDVVHAHNWIINSYLPLPAARRLPLVHSLHDYSHVCPTKRLMFDGRAVLGSGAGQVLRLHPRPLRRGPRTGDPGRRARRACRSGAAWSTSSPRSARFVGKANRLDEQGVRWQVVPNFVPDELTRLPALPRDPALPGATYLFFAGDLSEQKGVGTLLAACVEPGRGDPARRW